MDQKSYYFKVLGLVVFLLLFGAFSYSPVKAANEAMFSFSSDKTEYKVGEEGTITCSVDAGPYSSTLNVVDMDINISDTSVIEVKNSSSPFVSGSIFSVIGMQSLSGSTVNVVTYINPSSKPASRSGVIGTMQIKALKSGQATLKYDRIEAAEEGKENEWASTAASSLIINVSADSSSGTTATPVPSGVITTQDSVSDASTVSVASTRTATASARSAATSATTGPESLIYIIIIGTLGLFLGYKVLSKSARKI